MSHSASARRFKPHLPPPPPPRPQASFNPTLFQFLQLSDVGCLVHGPVPTAISAQSPLLTAPSHPRSAVWVAKGCQSVADGSPGTLPLPSWASSSTSRRLPKCKQPEHSNLIAGIFCTLNPPNCHGAIKRPQSESRRHLDTELGISWDAIFLGPLLCLAYVLRGLRVEPKQSFNPHSE